MRLSLIRLFAGLIHLLQLSIDTDIDSRLYQRVDLQHLRESLPVIAQPLASPVKPLEQHSFYRKVKSIDAPAVVRDTVVVIITHQNPVQLFYYIFYRLVPHISDQPIHFPAFLAELLLSGFPLDSELSVPVLGTVVCETKESKGVRFPAGCPAVLFRIPAEPDQP